MSDGGLDAAELTRMAHRARAGQRDDAQSRGSGKHAEERLAEMLKEGQGAGMYGGR